VESTGKTVLVVEDDQKIRQLIVRILQSRGHGTITAENGSEALEVFDANPEIDLVILDVMMPVMDGFSTIVALRKRARGDVPVVMQTSLSGGDSLMAGYQAGADYYLTKPFKPSALVNIVDYLIGDLPPEQRSRLERLI
jgi:DNA-binding response OmpR family regulator